MLARLWPLAIVLGVGLLGCTSEPLVPRDASHRPYNPRKVATSVEYPAICPVNNAAVETTLPPRTLSSPNPGEIPYWDLKLEDAVRIGLANSRVFRDIGGRLLTAPAAALSVYNPAIQESDPVQGVEAALSAFDATFTAQGAWQRLERPINFTIGGFVPSIQEQDLFNGSMELQKTNAAGGRTFIRHNVDYSWSNNASLRFPSAWEGNIEAEFRQPLLQGAGLDVNRILGPNASAGFNFGTGVLIARVNTDIAIADFEIGVRDLVNDLENAYWNLYFAYRDLDAQIAGRDSALATWRRVKNFEDVSAKGGEADQEAQARSQYYLFVGLVEDALSGRRTGSTAFAASGGLYAREADLRLLMGLPQNDGRLIRPIEEPTVARVEMEWSKVLAEALMRRAELRRQRWVIKGRELRLRASHNFLLPQLDAQALYRWYGFGDNYLDPERGEQFDNAWQEITGGDYQEWQMGFLFSVPLGERQAHAAVRNAELQLARERAVLHDQELVIASNLGGALRELERSYARTITDFNRRIATQREVEAVEARYLVGEGATLDVLLEAQRRRSEAERDFFRSRVEYVLAIKQLQFEKGTLLEYNGIHLAEGGWHAKAYRDACNLAEKLAPTLIDYGLRHEPAPFASAAPLSSYAGEIQVHAETPRDEPRLVPFVDENQKTPSPVEPPEGQQRPDAGEEAVRDAVQPEPAEGASSSIAPLLTPAAAGLPRFPQQPIRSMNFEVPADDEWNEPLSSPVEFGAEPQQPEPQPMRIQLGAWTDAAAGGIQQVSFETEVAIDLHEQIEWIDGVQVAGVGPGFIERNAQAAQPRAYYPRGMGYPVPQAQAYRQAVPVPVQRQTAPPAQVYYVPTPVAVQTEPADAVQRVSAREFAPDRPVLQAMPAASAAPLRSAAVAQPYAVPAETVLSQPLDGPTVTFEPVAAEPIASKPTAPKREVIRSTPEVIRSTVEPRPIRASEAMQARPLPVDEDVELLPAPRSEPEPIRVRLSN